MVFKERSGARAALDILRSNVFLFAADVMTANGDKVQSGTLI